MKSTYKLIGAFWDHRETLGSPLTLVEYDPTYLAAGSALCLFDFLEMKRSVMLSELMSADGVTDVEGVLEGLREADKVAVVVDIAPRSTGEVQSRFFRKRALQALRMVVDELLESEIILMLPNREASA